MKYNNNNQSNIKASHNSKILAEEFINLDEMITQQTGLSLAKSITALQDPTVYAICKNYYLENSYNPEDFDNDPELINEYVQSIETKFDNNIRAMFDNLNESAGTNGSLGITNLNAIIGLSLPVSKNILMNNMFLNTLPTSVVDSKIVTKQFEVRRLVDPITREVIDLYSQQSKIFDTLFKSNPVKKITIEAGQTVDVVEELALGQNENIDNVKVHTVKVAVTLKEGDVLPDGSVADSDKNDTEEELDIRLDDVQLNQTYNDPTLLHDIVFNGRNLGQIVVTRRYNNITLLTQNDKIKSVEVLLVKDNSVLSSPPPRVEWEVKSEQISIDNMVHVATSYTPQTAYDHKTLHDVNILSTIVESTKTVLEDYKDAYIINGLEKDYKNMHPTQKISREVDFAAKDGFYGSIQDWINSIFMFSLDDVIDALFGIINDPNAEVLIYGRPGLISKVMPKNENGRISNYKGNGNGGSQNIEFAKTTFSTANRKTSYISSQKLNKKYDSNLPNDDLILVLNPTNERTMYKLLEYQTYIGSDIKPAAAAHLPTVTAFDRFELIKFEAVQGRIKVLNPGGIRSDQTDANIEHSIPDVASINRKLVAISPEYKE